MTIFFETYASRKSEAGPNANVRLMALFGRDDDEQAVMAYVLDNTDLIYADTLPRLRVEIDPVGNGYWQCQIDYGIGPKNQDSPPGGGSGGDTNENDALPVEVTVDGGNATLHVTQSLKTVQAKGRIDMPDIEPIDYEGSINVSHNGNGSGMQVGGCDIPVPALTWTETWTWKAQYVTWKYLKQLSDIQGRYNLLPERKPGVAPTFRSFVNGEIMFTTWHSEPQGALLRKISYTFIRQPNVAGFSLTPKHQPVDKLGFQYLWVDYMPRPKKAGIALVPRFVYVEEVGRGGLPQSANGVDFGHPTTGLGIGR